MVGQIGGRWVLRVLDFQESRIVLMVGQIRGGWVQSEVPGQESRFRNTKFKAGGSRVKCLARNPEFIKIREIWTWS